MHATPVWISHRGFKDSAVENTLEAFRGAVAVGFRALETDLRLTADGHIVLHHDPDLKRLAGEPRDIAALPRPLLEGFRLGETQARLLFLDQFIDEFLGCSWTFDVKPETGAAVIRALHGWAQARGIYDLLVAQSKFVTWSAADEALLKSLFPGAALYAREPECWRAGLSLIAGLPGLGGLKADRTYALPPRLGRVELYRDKIVAAVHRHGAKLIAFLPENEADARAAARCGYDEILTNGRPFLNE